MAWFLNYYLLRYPVSNSFKSNTKITYHTSSSDNSSKSKVPHGSINLLIYTKQMMLMINSVFESNSVLLAYESANRSSRSLRSSML